MAELAARAAGTRPLGVVTSIFFGGGTQSMWPPSYLAAIINNIRDRLGLAHGAEITIELNPGYLLSIADRAQ